MTAGYELAKKGHVVTVYESEEEIGGLVSTIKVGGEDLERFYHHLFTSDTEIVKLVNELGLSSELMWISPKNGVYLNEKFYPFSTPADLLLFREIPLLERIAMGLLVIRARFIKDWQNLENINARDWVVRNAGRNAYEKFWRPLLNSKFDCDADRVSAAWLWNKLKLRGSTRGQNMNNEMFGYMKGSFKVVFKNLAEKIKSSGGKVICSKTVRQILPKNDKSLDIITDDGMKNFDRVIVTSSPSIFKDIAAQIPGWYIESLNKLKYKANICVLLELSERLTPYYWTTIADDKFPFVAVIEQTNLVPVKDSGSHFVYLTRYLDEKNEMYSFSDEQVEKLFIDYLKQLFMGFDESKIKKVHISRALYTQPVVITGYSKIVPDYKTPVENLYLANMTQIYPEDRGQNYSVRLGKQIAQIVDENKH